MSNVSLETQSAPFCPATLVAPFVQGWAYRLLKAVFGLGVFSGLVGSLYTSGPTLLMSGQGQWFSEAGSVYLGLMLMSAAAYLLLQLAHYFFNSYYFSGLDTLLIADNISEGIVYEVAAVLLESPHDVTAGFVHSLFGQRVLNRLGLGDTDMQTFLQTERKLVSAATCTPTAATQVTLLELARILSECDVSFQAWLQKQGIQMSSFLRAAAWTHREHVANKRRERWWSRDQLSQKTGIGHDFIYGVAYTLEQYSKSLTTGVVYHDRAPQVIVHPHILEVTEQQLVQPGSGNVLLVGEAGVGKLDIVTELAERFAHGEALGSLVSPQMRLLDTERLLADVGDKATFEQRLLQLLEEAAAAGNTIIVIDDLPSFITSAANYGISVSTLLDEYISKTALRVIATSTTAAYHRDLEANSQLLRLFHIEMVTVPDTEATLRILEELATKQQLQTGRVVTQQALERITSAADRYVVHGVMPDKALHLFDEIMSVATDSKHGLVTVAVVDAYINDVTGVPVGPIDDEERTLLLDLERVLHERIVGQEAAVAAISSVMRRARADIQASNKPLGSFLFMGPTGVGKTESAKALAAVFFKREEAMHRFDMSEYSGADALAKLIGTTTSTGSLAAALIEQPYAVVLLDEFEKAAESVHDVFLQILDEGQFTDGSGQRINARNTIIIATSNAGSNLIMDWLEIGADLNKKQTELINHVIEAGIYKPELVNRFDDVVLFAPLRQSEQRQIARQLLEALALRIQEKGYTIEITDELVDTVAKLGYDAEFGARSMRRTIQSAVEDRIAERVIAGDLKPGDTITFSDAELATFI